MTFLHLCQSVVERPRVMLIAVFTFVIISSIIYTFLQKKSTGHSMEFCQVRPDIGYIIAKKYVFDKSQYCAISKAHRLFF